MNDAHWICTLFRLPAEDQLVETMICDDEGSHNEARLRYYRGLWFYEDKSMYVYYRPTHWRPAP